MTTLQWVFIALEKPTSPRDTVAALEANGRKISVKSAMGSTQSIHVDADKGPLLGASDPRRTGSATVGY